ncbi:MaoC family dehydratase N-terminal domain-containing protein [Streptomyces sp. NPDC090077]|uniref:FAS1-like dehydratase domain-containing protein n=1 Tax=Streptomyces sp. NPDC090077 TaxID=3365938 RepID=UPI0037F30730
MPVDASLAGTSYRPDALHEVDRAAIRAFAEAVGAHSPVHRDPGAARALGYPDVIAPPTFVFRVAHDSCTRLLRSPELGLASAHLVHADQRIVQLRPVRAGDRLAVTAHLDAVGRLRDSDVLRMRAEVRDEAGEQIAETRMTVVAKDPEEPE